MRKLVQRLARRVLLKMQQANEVASFEGIRIADFGNKQRAPRFHEVIIESLTLLRAVDPQRYQRVREHIACISNQTTEVGGATYKAYSKTCEIDFDDPVCQEWTDEFRVGWFAATLVHEATHGVIEAKGIRYLPEFRGRIERLCVKEEQRFIRRLEESRPELAAQLIFPFEESHWEESWTISTKGDKFRHLLKRLRERL